MTYYQDVLITDARTGKTLRVVRVCSSSPISSKAAIHKVIEQEKNNGR